MTTEPKIVIPPIESGPYSEKTRAILNAISSVEEKVNHLQNVAEAIRQVQKAEQSYLDKWREAIKRAVTTFVSLMEWEKKKHE